MSKSYDIKFLKRIPGFSRYYACNDGRIYKKGKKNFKQLIEYRQPNSKYLGVYLYKRKYEKLGFQVHELVASAFYRINIFHYDVLHKDKNCLNNVPGNLVPVIMSREKIRANKENLYFDKKNLVDYEAILKSYLKYDTSHYLWKKYIKLKSEKKYRICLNWLKLLLSSKNLL